MWLAAYRRELIAGGRSITQHTDGIRQGRTHNMKVTLIKYIFPLLLTIAQTASGHNSMVPLESRRSVEQTLLTFPEWFLVHSPSEYARLLYIQPAHDFPYMGHVSQV